MNVASLLTKAYRLTNTNATTFLDGNSTNVLADLNTCYGHRMIDLSEVRVDFNHLITEKTATLLSTSGLVAGDIGFNGEYPFETDTLRPVRIEISYDGTSWYPATIYDLNDNSLSEHEEDAIQGNFSQTEPYVRFERDSYFIRPLKTTTGNISAGIHIWYEKRQSDLTTGSPDFEANLNDILSFDLAKLESIMHPDKYTKEWREDFNLEYFKSEQRFLKFYKNRFKRSNQLVVDYPDYK